jgi:hypothetical protein
VRAGTAYSGDKWVYNCSSCSNDRHVCVRANDTVSRDLRTLQCRVCSGGGSKHEHEAYTCMDRIKQVTLWAAEVHALQGTYEWEGQQLQLGDHRWDIMVLQPVRLLVAVQGEQHDCNPNNREHSISADLEDSLARDRALADAAVRQHLPVVWLVPGDPFDRSGRWCRLIRAAVADALKRRKPRLYTE